MTLLLLASPYIPGFCCIAVGPAVAVALSAVDVEFLAVSGVSALTDAPNAVDVLSDTGVSNGSGISAFFGVPAVACQLLASLLLWLPSQLLQTSFLLVAGLPAVVGSLRCCWRARC